MLELRMEDTGLHLLEEGFLTAPPPDFYAGEYPMLARVTRPGGNLLGEFGVEGPREVAAEQGYPRPMWLATVDITLVLPYYGSIGRATIVETATSQTLLSADLSRYAVPNSPPTARAGENQLLECEGSGSATARLDASASTDVDSSPGTNDDIVSYLWAEGSTSHSRGPWPRCRSRSAATR